MSKSAMTSSYRISFSTRAIQSSGCQNLRSKCILAEISVGNIPCRWLTLCFSDGDFSNFEFAHFLSGTHVDEDRPNDPSVIQELKIRIPKFSKTEKTTIDYSKLNRQDHSKVQIVSSIPHEGEVLKCRQNPFNDQNVASILTSGVVNIYKKDGTLTGKLHGLSDETFCLDWNK